MKTLYVDTSSSWLYAGLVEDDQLLDCIKEELKTDLSTLALDHIAKMLERKQVKPDEIDEFVIVTGPGSFTGIRIGLTIVKTWAWAKEKTVYPISSLEAMALSGKAASFYVPMIDARRNYYYAGIHDANGNNVFKDTHIYLEDFQKELTNYHDVLVISNEEVNLTLPKMAYDPDILTIVKKARMKKPVNPHALEPNYLKRTEAEEKLEEHDKDVGA